MMKKTWLIITSLAPFISFSQEPVKKKVNRITIQGQIPPHYKKEDIELKSFPTPTVKIGYTSDEAKTISKKVVNGCVKWEYNVDYPLDMIGTFIKNQYVSLITLEPGDSIVISYQEGNVVYSGKGNEKLQLLYKLGKLSDSLDRLPAYKTLSHKSDKPNSIRDYLSWVEFINRKEQLILPLIDSYRSKLSTFGYNNIKEQLLSRLELIKVEKFYRLRGKSQTDNNAAREIMNQYGLTNKDMAAIFDSTQNGPGAHWLEFEAPLVNDPYYLLEKLTLDAYRQKGEFIKKEESDSSIIGEGVDYWTRMYAMGKEKYTEIRGEALLSFILWYPRGSIYYHGFVPEVEAMLADYYKGSTYTRYRDFTRKYELNKRESYNAKVAPGFTLTDSKGGSFSSEKLKGKIAVIDFWFTGCTGCVQMAPALRKVEEFFKNDTNVVFLNISTDKDRQQWMKSVELGKYTSGGGINLFTSGKGREHDVIKKYGIDGYPALYLIDQFNRVIRPAFSPDPRHDGGKKMIGLLQKQLTLMKDGPFVFHSGDSVSVYSINGSSVSNKRFNKGAQAILRSQTDILNKTFNISLKRSLSIPPAEYERPEKLLVLSDIEGNFDAFRKLLQSNKIIDEDFNWVYGKGHLVFAGDMFDRGEQVTECLWLVYALEEKAKAVGGCVHFVLGNHERMNLIGNNKYSQPKYSDNAALIGKKLPELYNENSELGRWLRTKNIVERIGDLLFTHGGISRKLNQTSLTVQEINEVARPYYASYKKDYGDEKINTILSDRIGPLWYRGYYQGEVSGEMKQVIDSTLQKFNVAHIVTGHTIVADTISTHYENKVINTDTRHANGKSEALLIEANNFYRVNGEGEKRLLFAEMSRKNLDYISTN